MLSRTTPTRDGPDREEQLALYDDAKQSGAVTALILLQCSSGDHQSTPLDVSVCHGVAWR